nr:PREDICTED: translation initiation factor IF-2-like [Macaca fascicularis]
MCGHGREGEEGTGRRRVGRPLRGGDGGGRGAPGSPRGCGAGARDDTSPRSTCRRPMETQLLRRSIEWRTDLGDPPGFLGAPAPSSRESGAKVLAPQEMRPSSPSLRRGDSASLPGPAKRRCRRQTDAHPRLLGPPGTPAPHGAGRPSPAGPVQRVPWRPRLPASASGAVLSGPGGGASAGPAPPPPPAGSAPSGTSLTSRPSDVRGRVPGRERRAGQGGRRGGGGAAAPPTGATGAPRPDSAPAPWL